MRKPGTNLCLSVLLLFFGSYGLSQENQAGGEPQPEEQTVNVTAAAPALFSVGVSGGFPSYQTVALAVSLQSSFVGLQAKGSWTAAGPFIGLQLRGYPPVPIPVPLYVGVGLGIYGPNVSYHAAVGTHVPLGRALRLDLEGGAAWVPLLDRRQLAPHVAVGVSYAIPFEVDLSDSAARSEIGRTVGERREVVPTAPPCAEPREPDPGLLSDAVERVVDDWITSARATYGSVYTDLSYSYSITSRNVSGDEATVNVSYRGSVSEIATGKRHSASGKATAEFRWTGCVWAGGAVSY